MSVTVKELESIGVPHEEAVEYARAANGQLDTTLVDELLDKVDQATDGFGVEAITSEHVGHSGYYQNIIALYVNQGDTYTETLLFDVESHEFLVTSWGTWFEGWEQEHPEATLDSVVEQYPSHGQEAVDIAEAFDAPEHASAMAHAMETKSPNDALDKIAELLGIDLAIDMAVAITHERKHIGYGACVDDNGETTVFYDAETKRYMAMSMDDFIDLVDERSGAGESPDL